VLDLPDFLLEPGTNFCGNIRHGFLDASRTGKMDAPRQRIARR